MKNINRVFKNADEIILIVEMLGVGFNDQLLLSLHSLRMEEIWLEEKRATK